MGGDESELSVKKTEFQQRILGWYQEQGRMFPWRKGRTRWGRDPYRVLVSEVMLQQTQADRVIPYYSRWIRRWPTVASLARARRASVIRAWAGLGYNRRAVYLHEAAQMVVDAFSGRFPRKEEELMRLPGVGRYTARAILAFAYGKDVGVLETNTKRIILRTFLGVSSLSELKFLLDQGEIVTSLVTQRSNQESVPHERSVRPSALRSSTVRLRPNRLRLEEISPRSLMSSNSVAVKARQTVDDFSEEFARLILTSCVQRGVRRSSAPTENFGENNLLMLADYVVPKGRGDVWNQAMMDFGAMVCTAKKPKCEECPLRKMCSWYANGRKQGMVKWSNGQIVRRGRFEETDRYFRGRIVDIVRRNSIRKDQLCKMMKKDFNLIDSERFKRLVGDLVSDGLISVSGESISLPT